MTSPACPTSIPMAISTTPPAPSAAAWCATGPGVIGAHVIAFNPKTGAIIGGFSIGEGGTFQIAGLTPGAHVIRVEPLDDADIDSFFSPTRHRCRFSSDAVPTAHRRSGRRRERSLRRLGAAEVIVAQHRSIAVLVVADRVHGPRPDRSAAAPSAVGSRRRILWRRDAGRRGRQSAHERERSLPAVRHVEPAGRDDRPRPARGDRSHAALWTGGAHAVRTSRLHTSVTNDVENAPSVDAVERLDQYSFDGGIVIRLSELRMKSWEPFASAGAGYLRQLHEGLTLSEHGHLFYFGGGVRRVLLVRPKGLLRGLGVRGDVRLTMLSGGITVEDKRRNHFSGSASVRGLQSGQRARQSRSDHACSPRADSRLIAARGRCGIHWRH